MSHEPGAGRGHHRAVCAEPVPEAHPALLPEPPAERPGRRNGAGMAGAADAGHLGELLALDRADRSGAPPRGRHLGGGGPLRARDEGAPGPPRAAEMDACSGCRHAAGCRHTARGGAACWHGGCRELAGGVPGAGTEPSSENPPQQPSIENLGGADAPELALKTEDERRTSRTSGSQGEAEQLFGRLERLRGERQAQLGRPVSPSRPEIWLPKLRRAIKVFGSPGAVEDAWVWLLRSPTASWHRGEEKGGPDRTLDFATLLAHPEYAEKRDWKGPFGADEARDRGRAGLARRRWAPGARTSVEAAQSCSRSRPWATRPRTA
jgi:hypothetical protein